MPAILPPELGWLITAAIAAGMTLGCLKTIAREFDSGVRWHDLRVTVKILRLEQQRAMNEERAASEAVAAGVEPAAASAETTGVEVSDVAGTIDDAPVAEAA